MANAATPPKHHKLTEFELSQASTDRVPATRCKQYNKLGQTYIASFVTRAAVGRMSMYQRVFLFRKQVARRLRSEA